MISREGFGYNAACDSCSYDEDMDNADNFQEVVDELKAQGWRIRRAGAGWEHTCPDCISKEKPFILNGH